jgi:hypothetical protein
MGRFSLTESEKKKQLNASVPKMVIDKIGSRESKKIAEEAVLKEYKKQMKQ